MFIMGKIIFLLWENRNQNHRTLRTESWKKGHFGNVAELLLRAHSNITVATLPIYLSFLLPSYAMRAYEIFLTFFTSNRKQNAQNKDGLLRIGQILGTFGYFLNSLIMTIIYNFRLSGEFVYH